MIRASIIAGLLVALAATDIVARSHHRSYRHQYDPTFCRDIIVAFDQLPVRDLDAYVSSIPEQKRKQAARCLKGKAR